MFCTAIEFLTAICEIHIQIDSTLYLRIESVGRFSDEANLLSDINKTCRAIAPDLDQIIQKETHLYSIARRPLETIRCRITRRLAPLRLRRRRRLPPKLRPL